MESKNQIDREIPSRPFCTDAVVPPDFIVFAVDSVLPNVQLKGYKFSKKYELAIRATHNLVLTGLTGKCVSDSRRKTDPSARLRVAVWDAIVAAGYARICLGSEASHRVTRYRATTSLLDLRKIWELRQLMNLDLKRNSELATPVAHALVYGHTGRFDLATSRLLPEEDQGQPLPIPDGFALEQFKEFENSIEAINRNNLRFRWVAFDENPDTGSSRIRPVNPCIRQIHVGCFFRAMRMYSWGELSGQNLSKAERQTILIDDEPVTELDFKTMAIRLLYHAMKVEAEGMDLYHPERLFPRFYARANVNGRRRALVRSLAKLATNICLNTKSRQAANSAVAFALKSHADSQFARNLLRNTEGITSAELIDRIIEVHPEAVTKHFFTEVGMWLMTLDGLIMLRILETFTLAGRPALSIHDSLVVRQSDYEFARDTMNNCYYGIVKQRPEISIEY